MMLTSFALSGLLVAPLSLSALAHPTLESRQDDDVAANVSTVSGVANDTSAFSVSGNPGAPTFESYLNSGLDSIQRNTGKPATIQFIEIRTFDGAPPQFGSSASADNFLKMKINWRSMPAGGIYQITNWDAQDYGGLDTWHFAKGDTYDSRYNVLKDFKREDFENLTLASAFRKLQAAGWHSTKWTMTLILRFATARLTRQDEVFYAFRSRGFREWVYVGATSGEVFQDREPIAFGGFLETVASVSR